MFSQQQHTTPVNNACVLLYRLHSITVTVKVTVTVALGSIVPKDMHSGVTFSCGALLTLMLLGWKQKERGKAICNAAHCIVHVAVFVIVIVNVTSEHTFVQQLSQVITTVGPHAVGVQVDTQQLLKFGKLLLQKNIFNFHLQFVSIYLAHLFI